MNDEYKGFTIVPNSIFNLDLTSNELSLYVVILSFYNKEKQYAYPSYKQLKARSGIKKDETLIKYINSLIEKNLLEKQTIKGIGSKYYLPTTIMEYLQNESTSEKGVRLTPKKGEDLRRKRSTTNTNTNTNTNNICPSDKKVVDIKSKEAKKIKKNKKDLEVSEMFEQLWSIYPRKEGKGQARNHSKKLLSKYSFEEIERAVTRYANKCTKDKTEKQFIK